MAAVGIVSVEQTTDRSTTSNTYVDITDASIASGSFQANTTYLILAGAIVTGANGTITYVDVTNASDTSIAPAESIAETRGSSDGEPHFFAFEFAQGGSPVGIKLRFHTTSGVSITSVTSWIIAIPVTGFAGADYSKNEDDDSGAPVDVPTSTTAFATTTFTGTTDTWLAIAYVLYDVNTTSQKLVFALDRTGSASETITNQREGEATSERRGSIIVWADTLTAVSNTFSVKINTDGADTDFDHIFSGIYLLNLDELFADVSFARTTGATSALTSTFAQAQTLAHAVTVDGDQIILGYAQSDVVTHQASFGLRFQEDNTTTLPTGIDDAALNSASRDATDIIPLALMSVRNMLASGSPFTIDMDAADDRQTTNPVDNRCLVVFSDEAAAGGAEYTQAAAGAITPTGALATVYIQTQAAAGTLTSAGALARKTLKALAGVVTPAGSLARKTLKLLAGSLTPSGVLTTIYVQFQAAAGALTPAGSLARKTLKALAGSLTPTGSLARKALKAVAGVLTPAGALASKTLKPLAGVVTPTGALSTVFTSGGVIFNITHEVGDLSEYTSTVTDSGDLSVTGAAALVGNYGLSALIDDTNGIFGEIEYTQITSGEYRWRFYVDPNGLTMAGGDAFYLCRITKQETSGRADVNLKYSGGYNINARVREDDGTYRVTADYVITDDVHYIECLVQYASGPTGNDGILTLWIDGVQKESITDVDLDGRSQPDEAFLGPHSNIDAGTSGTLYLDDFVLRDDSTEIGAAPAAAGNPWYAYVQQ